jgi:hypothetical protein
VNQCLQLGLKDKQQTLAAALLFANVANHFYTPTFIVVQE